MISSVEMRIIERAMMTIANAGGDIGSVLRSYSNLTFDEKNEIYRRLMGKNLPISLEEVKANKIAELGAICNATIEAGVDVELGDHIEHFSYKLANGDQTNIDNLMVSARTTGMPQPYHCDGGNCRMYSVEEIFKIYIALITNKTMQTTYFNQLKQYILNDFKSESDVAFITPIKYGDKLIGEYMSRYVEILKESNDILNQFVAKFHKEMKMSAGVTNISAEPKNPK